MRFAINITSANKCAAEAGNYIYKFAKIIFDFVSECSRL
jgi:hypothetical protein